MAEDTRIDEGTLERIWSNLMNHLCERHGRQARNVNPTSDNPRPTDWEIENLRNGRYGGYDDAAYFRRHLAELANRHPEIQIEGDVIRLTPQGVDYCNSNFPGWQREFK